ncbi:hypothetical protein D3C71_1575460 [compost metagenome]
MVGTYQMITGGLAGRVRAVRLVLVAFAERGFILGQRAIDFVGRHMQEAKRLLRIGCQALPVSAHGFQQAERTNDVGLNEVFRTVNGAINVRLGGEVQDCARLMLFQQAGHQGAVTDITTHKYVPLVTGQAAEVIQVACIGQLVQIDHSLIRLSQPVQYEVRTDETCTASY